MSLTAGIHTIPLAEYLADPAPEPSLSHSLAHLLLTKSPAHAWTASPRLNPHYQREDDTKFDIGSAAHAVLLEGDYKRLAVVNAKDYRTKEAQATRDESRAAGMIPVLTEKMVEIEDMVTVAKAGINQSELADAFIMGKPEQTLIWQKRGVWLRSRPDWLTLDYKRLIDYKTTAGSAEPNAWARGPMIAQGYDLQAAMGLSGLNRLIGEDTRTFTFVVQEVEPPYAVSFVGMSPHYLEFSHRRLTRAMTDWGACVLNKNWPTYSTRIAYMDLPPWLETREEEQVWVQAEKENWK